MSFALEAARISKAYGTLKALDSLTLTIPITDCP